MWVVVLVLLVMVHRLLLMLTLLLLLLLYLLLRLSEHPFQCNDMTLCPFERFIPVVPLCVQASDVIYRFTEYLPFARLYPTLGRHAVPQIIEELLHLFTPFSLGHLVRDFKLGRPGVRRLLRHARTASAA